MPELLCVCKGGGGIALAAERRGKSLYFRQTFPGGRPAGLPDGHNRRRNRQGAHKSRKPQENRAWPQRTGVHHLCLDHRVQCRHEASRRCGQPRLAGQGRKANPLDSIGKIAEVCSTAQDSPFIRQWKPFPVLQAPISLVSGALQGSGALLSGALQAPVSLISGAAGGIFNAISGLLCTVSGGRLSLPGSTCTSANARCRRKPLKA